MPKKQEENTLQIIILFSIILFVIFIFLTRVAFISLHKPNHFISKVISHQDLAVRGKIISKDNFTIAKNEKIYSVAIIPKYIKDNKKELFYNLLSIYTDVPATKFKNIIQTTLTNNPKVSRVILLKHIPYQIKKNLEYLSSVFAIKDVFSANNKKIIYSLDIFEENSKRIYPFKNRLEPVLGYARWNAKHKRVGMGIEKFYDSVLMPKQNGYIKGYRDVQNKIIYDNKLIVKKRIDGKNLKLNINLILQGKIENLLDRLKPQMKAKEIISVVMNSRTGNIVAIASSNRYNPMHIKQKDIPNLKISHIQYTYEPGSVMKPIILALLLKHKKVNIYEIIDAHNGVYHFRRHFTIYDDDRFKYLNVINALIHSSNIVFAQLGLRLTPKEFRDGLLSFGFSKKSGIDLPYEYRGIIFSQNDLISDIHRASNSFGYAMGVNLIQLLKAYNVFNNNGILITPKVTYSYSNIILEHRKQQLISPAIAQIVLNILRKVVLKGTGVAANIPGLFIAGKTGTAKINKDGHYIKGLYNSSFIGFVNDDKHKYTIATLVIKPDPKHFFASQTAVVTFKNIVEEMVNLEMLKPKEEIKSLNP